jgi:hypothetical protein
VRSLTLFRNNKIRDSSRRLLQFRGSRRESLRGIFALALPQEREFLWPVSGKVERLSSHRRLAPVQANGRPPVHNARIPNTLPNTSPSPGGEGRGEGGRTPDCEPSDGQQAFMGGPIADDSAGPAAHGALVLRLPGKRIMGILGP